MDKYINKSDEIIMHALELAKKFTPKLIFAIVCLIIGLWVIKRLSKITQSRLLSKGLDVSLQTFLRSLVNIGLKIILIVIVANILGIGSSSFVTILGAASLAIGLALQGSLSNFAGGVLILMFKPYKINDVVEINGISGVVKEIQIFNTIVLTHDLKTVIFPNGSVSNSTMTNLTKNGILRNEVQIQLPIEVDLDKMKQMFLDEVFKIPNVLKTPAPFIMVLKITDNVVIISIRTFTTIEHFGDINSIILERVKKIINAHNILVPTTIQRISKM